MTESTKPTKPAKLTKLEQVYKSTGKLSVQEKRALLDKLTQDIQLSPLYDRNNAVSEVGELQQAKYIDDFYLHDWITKVLETDPERLSWHVRRLRGIGGSEIGTLWMAENGQFHPFHSCSDVVASKLLRQMPLDSEGNLQRGSMMEDPILRPKFREEMVKLYSSEGKTLRFRDDLFDKFMNYVDEDPKLVWLVGTPDDILEVDGKLIIVDYKAPTSGTIASLRRYSDDSAPIYYEAQLHHYATIAQKIGIPVDSLMLASLDYDKFTFNLKKIEVRPDFQQELLDVGTKYWFDYVMKGQIPNPQTNKSFSKEFELPNFHQQAVRDYAVLSIIANTAKQLRDDLQKGVSAVSTPIDANTDVVQAGMVNIEAHRHWDAKELEKDLTEFGIDTSGAWRKSDWNQKLLVEHLKSTLKISDENDPTLDAYRNRTDGEVNILDPHKLVTIARSEMDGLNLEPYIIQESCRLALSRSKTNSGPYVKNHLKTVNDACMGETIENLGEAYDNARKDFAISQGQENNHSKGKPSP